MPSLPTSMFSQISIRTGSQQGSVLTELAPANSWITLRRRALSIDASMETTGAHGCCDSHSEARGYANACFPSDGRRRSASLRRSKQANARFWSRCWPALSQRTKLTLDRALAVESQLQTNRFHLDPEESSYALDEARGIWSHVEPRNSHHHGDPGPRAGLAATDGTRTCTQSGRRCLGHHCPALRRGARDALEESGHH